MDVCFQVVNWHAADIEQETSDDDEGPSDPLHYVIKMFGVDANGKSVGCTVTGFTPFFYMKVDRLWNKNEMNKLVWTIKSKLGYRHQNTKISIRILQKRDFWGFTNMEDFWFLRIGFQSLRVMRSVAKMFYKATFKVSGITQSQFKLYENNIDPLLRFIHLRDLSPAGWVAIPKKYAEVDDVMPSKCVQDWKVNWLKVSPHANESFAPLTVASFDLECMSSDGDFPVPRKQYSKIATDLYNMYQSLSKDDKDEYTIKQAMCEYVVDLFKKGHLVLFYGGTSETDAAVGNIATKLKMMSDHMYQIVKGNPMIIEAAFENCLAQSFKLKPTYSYGKPPPTVDFGKHADRLLATYKSEKVQNMTLSSKSRYMRACFINLMNKYPELLKVEQEDPEDILERWMKVLFQDKVGLIWTLSEFLNKMLPEVRGDEIIQIGTTFHRYGETECFRKVILTLGSCDDIPDVEVVVCETEREMLMKWVELIDETDPDIITGWNIFGFDFSYIFERSIELGCMQQFCKLGRLRDHVSKFKKAKLSSSALGDNVLKYIHMEGRTLIDLMKVVQRDHKLDSYKLDYCANHFMNMNKHDVTPQDIFRLYKGTAKDRAIIADYCIQDCALCNKLTMKLEIIANNIGMANVCSVPMDWIFMRGQGVKIFSLVAKECKEQGFLVPCVRPKEQRGILGGAVDIGGEELDDASDERIDIGVAAGGGGLDEPPEQNDGYEGAIVLEPKTGIYVDTPIVILDYASLYPSSMISENLSHDCMVIDPAYDNLPGVLYLDITYDLYNGSGDEKQKVGEKVCRFAQLPDGQKGIIPNILNHLLHQRKSTRKRMTLQCITMSDGTVHEGYYKASSDHDATTATIATVSGEVITTEQKDVASVANKYNSFQKAILDGLQSAYKVTANSLYGQIGARTSPIYLKDIAACTTATGRKMIMLAKDFVETEYQAEVIYGDSVTGYTPTILRVNGNMVVETMEELGRKYGGDKWVRCVEKGRQDKFACELDGVETWTDDGWTKVHRVIRHELAEHKKTVRVLTHTGVADVTDDHSLLRQDKTMISPKEIKIGDLLLHHEFPAIPTKQEHYPTIEYAKMMGMAYDSFKVFPQLLLNAPVEVRRAFWDGLCDGTNGKLCMDETSQIRILRLSMLASSLGFATSLDVCGDIYRMTVTNHEPHHPDMVKKMYDIPYRGLVYDLTTDNHHFHIGAGKLIGHNTDSIFISFPQQLKSGQDQLTGKPALAKSINIGEEVSNRIKSLLKKPHDLEYEKTFFPMILFSKKRYCANKYETDINKFKQISMGIVLKRRDNANIVKKIYGGIIDIILNKHDVKGSIEFLKQSLQDLVNGKYPIEDLVITKTLKARYKDPDRIAHKVLAERIKERSPGSAPQVNDRIPYVYAKLKEPASKKEKLLQGERIELPDYVMENKIPLDYDFYLTNQIMNPILQLYALILEQLEGYNLPADHWIKQQQLLEEKGTSEKKIRQRIATLREREVKKLLFDPFLK